MSAATALAGTRVCVFDAYGTLFDVAAAANRWRDLLGGHAGPLTELWRRKQLEYTWLRSLMGRYEDFWHVTGAALDHAMAALAIADPGLRARLMASYLELDAYADAHAMLTRLKAAGRPTAILSNGSPSMLAAAVSAARIGRLLDAVLSVDPVAVYKPHPSVYALACERFACKPAEVCFVSANGWDVAGAASFGFQAVHIDRTRQPAEGLPGTPAARVSSLDELPHLLAL
ncbi:2-haloacid dehalogenase [Stella humosa]|uniref:(S)-2-haloacid dehalogenase n=1 Tax=Stella humosa TaxID=94 RepID=A0A3N1MB79_9PROT|nr:haloacid dehalogenase type II [Stella humosa]ROQ00971.1 2-haloacid dehalogenase [Stella humosa]BBK31338.1 haloacid dehalogenase [Stella humosa]